MASQSLTAYHPPQLLSCAHRQLEDLTGDDHKPAKLVSIKNSDSVMEQPNPEYTKWETRDQALLGYLLSSLSRETLMGVTTHTTSAAV
jgi:hypothetical protein